MSLHRGQFVTSQELGPGESTPAAAQPAGKSPSYGGDEQPFFRLELMRSLQLHRRLALSIAVAGLVVTGAFVAMKWPLYTAQSQVYIQPMSLKLMDQGNAARWPTDSNSYDSFIEQQVHSASQPDVLLDAMHRLRPGVWQQSGETEQEAAERLGQSIVVARIGASYEVAITARAHDPELSAQIANAVAASIIEKGSREERAGDPERLTLLKEEKQRIEKELDADRAEQVALNSQLGVAAIGTTPPDHYDEQIRSIHDELVKARTAHDEAAARLISLGPDGDLSSKALNAEADEVVAADPGLVTMKMSLNQRRATLISQMTNLTASHPLYKQDAAELAQIDASLGSMTKGLQEKAASRIEQKLRTDLDRTAVVEGKLNTQLAQLTGAAGSATPKLQRANDLATDIVRLQSRRATVDEQLHNLMLQDSVPGAAHLSAAALPPLHPTVSGIAKKALPMGLGSLVLALLAALIANNLDNKVYVAADVERVLGFAPMAELPDFAEVSDGVVEEHLLRLSATIEHARQRGGLKSCIFTGTSAGAGVSTLVSRMSSMLESMGRETVLVDASWTPSASPRASSSDLETSQPSGEPATQRGSRSTALVRQLSEEAETSQESLILTDAAPLAVSAETEYLAHFVDAVIVVAQSGVTTRAQLRDAAARLQRLDVAAVGFVLNRVGLKTADPAFRQSIQVTEQYLGLQSRSFKQNLEDQRRERKRQTASERLTSTPRMADLPQPETHVFYLPGWKATNPQGDVEAAKAEAKRLGYEVVER